MNDHDQTHAVNQKIFQMGLTMETVSVYLLCCGLAEAGAALSFKSLAEVWNGTPSQLRDGLKELETRNVLQVIVSDSGEHSFYRLAKGDQWKCH